MCFICVATMLELMNGIYNGRIGINDTSNCISGLVLSKSIHFLAIGASYITREAEEKACLLKTRRSLLFELSVGTRPPPKCGDFDGEIEL